MSTHCIWKFYWFYFYYKNLFILWSINKDGRSPLVNDTYTQCIVVFHSTIILIIKQLVVVFYELLSTFDKSVVQINHISSHNWIKLPWHWVYLTLGVSKIYDWIKILLQLSIFHITIRYHTSLSKHFSTENKRALSIYDIFWCFILT